jgi:hypothetical protein
MASPAPAAPSAPAQQGPGDGVGAATTAENQSSEGRDIQRVDQLSQETGRKIRPIPNRPKLPGVDDISGPGFQLPPAPKNRTRTPDGKFAPEEARATEQQDGQQQIEDAGQEQEGQESGPFEFGGVRFETREKAEQSFKTLRGMHRAMEQRSAEAEQKHQEARTRAWELHNAYQAAQAELAQLRAGTQPIATQPGQPATEAKPGEGKIDWTLYREIRKQSDAAGRPEIAEQWLQEQNDRILRANTEKMVIDMLADKLQPLEALTQEREYDQAKHVVFAHTEAITNKLASYVNRDGRATYPELHDSQMADGVGRLWTTMGLDPRSALTESGMIAAIGLYRMWRAQGELSQAAVDAAGQAATTPNQPQYQDGQGGGDVDAGVDGGGAPFDRQPIAERNVPPEVKRLRQAFKSGGQIASLGFDR